MSPALGESTILTLLGSQDGTKIGPRSPQDRLKIVLKRDRFLRRFLIDFWSSWAPFWLPFCDPRCPKYDQCAAEKLDAEQPLPFGLGIDLLVMMLASKDVSNQGRYALPGRKTRG